VIYVVRSSTGQFYRRGKLVKSHAAASFGHCPSGVAGILKRAQATFPALQWEAVPFRDAAPYCAKLIGPCPDGCAGVKVACGRPGELHGDCWRVKPPHLSICASQDDCSKE
jgi:hypothetical protein